MSDQVEQLEMIAETKGSALSNSPAGKIIVVDDEPELKNILVEALSAQGFEVAGFSSGHQALEELRQRDFDLLLTDLMMPEMDGIALLEAALQIDPQLIGIIMTGQGTIQTAVDAMKVGAFDYVLKPFRLQAVMPVLSRAIGVRRLRMENLQLRETVAIFSLCQTIAFTLDPQTVISKLADAALQQTDADEVSVLLPGGDGRDELYVAAVRGEHRERLLGQPVPLEESISGWVAREREPLMLEGEIDDDRFRSLWPHPEIRSAIAIPMEVGNKLIGTININAVSRLRPFTVGQMKALTILASTAAAALESASLYRQVQRAEENYHSIFENAVEGIFQATPDGCFTTVNPAMARILGYDSPAEMIAKITDVTHQLYVHPESRAEAARLDGERGILQGFEFEAYRKDGEKIWLSLNRRSVRDENGAELYREGSVEDITERKQAEAEQSRLNAEIKEQRERLNTIVATVPGVVFEAWGRPDTGNTTDFVSEYVEPMTGYSVSEWLSMPGLWLSIVHPDDKERVARESALHFAEGGNGELEFRWIRKDERIVWVRAHTIVIHDQEGMPVGVRGVVTDITERKRAEEALYETARSKAESLALLDTILSTAPIGFAFHNCDLVYERINESLAAINGLPVEEHIGRTLGEVLPEMAPMLEPLLRQVLKTGEPVIDLELNGETPADPGHKHYWLVSFYPVRMQGGEILGVGVLVSEITERKQAEEALRESEERYRDLVENAHDIIFSHDLDGTYTSVNRAGQQITGYTQEECLKLNIAQTISPEGLEKAREMLNRKLAGEMVTAYELEVMAKDGRRIAVEVNTKLIIQDGVPVGVQGIARDVSERKQLEEQLRQSQKMEAIGQLAGGVAHDFNNLLTVIGGYSELLLRRLPPESPLRSSAEEIKKASDRAGGLTRQLLAFSRKQILQPKVLDLNSVVSDLDKMLRRLIGEDIDLLTITDPALGQVKADPGQIEQVILNLAVNARDAMPSAGQLTIRTSNVCLSEDYAQHHVAAVAGNYVMLSLSDNGCGMDLGTKDRIFEPFFTTKVTGKGTGLGLSTVYGIVKQSGGNIWVYSEVGKGTTFKIYLPRVDELRNVGFAHGDSTPAPHGTETILLVEDEEQVRRIAHEMLETQGYQILVAVDGEEALEIGRQHEGEIDLMITDVVMPQMGGREAVERLSPLRPRMKVLYMSGYTDDAIVRHGLIDEELQFIEKPFTADALARKVRTVLDTKAG